MFRYLIFILTGISITSMAQERLAPFVDNAAKNYLKQKNGCLVIGLINNGKEQLFYYGNTESGNDTKPDSSSEFELGGLTETFTCVLFADRTLRGNMHIDDQLQKFLPIEIPSLVYQPVVCKPVERQIEPDYGSREGRMGIHFTPYVCVPDSTIHPQPVLLCYLASHTSGFPDLPSNLKSAVKGNPYEGYTENDLYAYLKKYQVEGQVGFDYKHSALGIALLGKAISAHSNMPFDRALKQFMLDSLNMLNTSVSLNNIQQKKLVSGYNVKNNKATYWKADFFSPYMGLHSTPADMMNFLSLNISKEKNYFSDLLDFTHNSRIKLGGLFSDDIEIALGWKIRPLDTNGKKIVYQSGMTSGFASYVGFVETSHTGVIILSANGVSVEEMGKYLLDTMEKINLE